MSRYHAAALSTSATYKAVSIILLVDGPIPPRCSSRSPGFVTKAQRSYEKTKKLWRLGATSLNRSFDHTLGTLQGVRGFNDPRAIRKADGNSVFVQTDAAGN